MKWGCHVAGQQGLRAPALLLWLTALLADCSTPGHAPPPWSASPAGANLAEYDLGPIELGKARRTGTVAESVASLDAGDATAAQNGATAAATTAVGENGAAASLASASTSDEAGAAGAAVLAAAAAPAAPKINRRCKRRRRELLEAAA